MGTIIAGASTLLTIFDTTAFGLVLVLFSFWSWLHGQNGNVRSNTRSNICGTLSATEFGLL